MVESLVRATGAVLEGSVMNREISQPQLFGIGEFSYGTGLSSKTLRYYHDIGLLPAAEVNPFSGYRSYSAAQLKDAAMVRVLRACGMGIPQMKEALTHPHLLPDLLDERRREIAAQRAAEDWALSEAPTWQGDIDCNVVRTRECEAQAWVGVQVELDLKDIADLDPRSHDEAMGDVEDRLVTGLEEALQRLVQSGSIGAPSELAGDGPVPWLGMASDAQHPSLIRLTMCMPVAKQPSEPISLEGVEVICGELPRRREAYVTRTLDLQPSADADAPVDGQDAQGDLPGAAGWLPGGPLPDRAMIALCLVAEREGAGVTQLRQRTTHEGHRSTVDVSLTVAQL